MTMTALKSLFTCGCRMYVILCRTIIWETKSKWCYW